jgi:murein DD-endopeptidase MepM/ murein hydrolase activator NlpD
MPKRLMVSILLVAAIVGGYYLYRMYRPASERLSTFRAWIVNPSAHPEWRLEAGSRCGEAPFIFPTNGMVGFLWDDSFGPGHRHQGIDIFGGNEVGVTPVIAAYPGYLTRLPEWKSSVIVRIPSDPLEPGRQIWTYYTHMATQEGTSFISGQFPPGTFEQYIEAGTLLGYQGNYSGDPNNPTGVHLHFSIVKDDGQGSFRNELEIRNTYDPSSYLGLRVNANENLDTVPVCEDDT